MQIETLPDADALAQRCAEAVAEGLRAALAERPDATVAFSGGSTPRPMLEHLATLDLPWDRIHVFQVDERVAPDGHDDRNWTMLADALVDRVDLPAGNVHPMPVTDPELKSAAIRYAGDLRAACGEPVVLDVVHLGIGADGHTASLLPDDPGLDEDDLDVTLAGPYQDRVRMTLTFPVLNRARSIVWEVVGADKASAVRQLARGGDIPAARARAAGALLLVDAAAGAEL